MDEKIRTALSEILSQCEVICSLMKRFGDDMEDFITDGILVHPVILQVGCGLKILLVDIRLLAFLKSHG